MITISRGDHSRHTKAFSTRVFESWEDFCHYVGQPKQGEKEGECFLQGQLLTLQSKEMTNGRRSYSNRYLENVGSMSVIGFDIDTGQEPELLIDRLRTEGLAFVAYSSFSDTPTKRKFRVVVRLARPFHVSPDLQRAKLTWKRAYAGIAQWIGAEFDSACLDLTRLFFTSRYPADIDPPSRLFVWSDGDAVDLDNWIVRADNREFDYLLPKPPPGEKLVREHARSSTDRVTAKGIDLVRWVKLTGGKLLLNTAIVANDIGDVISEGIDKSEVVCPFDDEHASCPGERKSGFFVSDPTPEYPSFGAYCCHASCQHRDRLEFVAGLIENGNLSIDDLKDADFYENGKDWDSPKRSEVADLVAGEILPWPFVIDYAAGRVLKVRPETEADDEREDIPVCGIIKPKATIRSETDEGYGTLVEITTRDGRAKEVIFKASMDAKDVTRLLRDRGLQVFGTRGAESAFRELVALLNPPRLITEATRPSFHANNKIFLSPLGQIVRAKASDDAEWRLMEGMRLDAVPIGTLDEWREQVATPCFEDPAHLPHLGIGILSGFVGPLVHMLELDTAMINLSGPTSRGKTSALKVQASAWGPTKGKESLRFEARGTANAMEALVERGNGVSVGLDELAHSKDVGALIFAIASGQGNNRMRSDGSGLRVTRRWRTFVLMTGEKSIREYVEASGKQFIGGMGVRCVDVSVAALPKHPNPMLIDEILANADRFNGTAGVAFVEHLLRREDLDSIRVEIERHRIELAGSKASGAELRASLPFGLLAVVGDIAKRAGVIPEKVDHMHCIRWASEQARQSAAMDALDTIEESIAEIQKFVSANIGGRIVRMGGSSGAGLTPMQGAAGWIDSSGRRIYLLWDEFQKLCRTDARAVATELVKRELAEPRLKGKDRTDPYHTSLPGKMTVKHIRLIFDATTEGEVRGSSSADVPKMWERFGQGVLGESI